VVVPRQLLTGDRELGVGELRIFHSLTIVRRRGGGG